MKTSMQQFFINQDDKMITSYDEKVNIFIYFFPYTDDIGLVSTPWAISGDNFKRLKEEDFTVNQIMALALQDFEKVEKEIKKCLEEEENENLESEEI